MLGGGTVEHDSDDVVDDEATHRTQRERVERTSTPSRFDRSQAIERAHPGKADAPASTFEVRWCASPDAVSQGPNETVQSPSPETTRDETVIRVTGERYRPDAAVDPETAERWLRSFAVWHHSTD